MSYDSIRNKALVEFPDGKLMLFYEVSCSNVTDAYGKRCWDKALMHPKGTLFYTKETLKQAQTEYVETQLKLMRDFSKFEVKNGWAKEYKEPTLDSYDYNGTRFPGGCRIRNGKSFYGGRPKKAEEFFGKWDAPSRIVLTAYDKDFNCIYNEAVDILKADLDEYYHDALKEHKQVYIGVR